MACGSWLIDAKTFFADSASGEREARPGSDGTCAAVEAVANAYYETMVAGDEAGMRNIFDPQAPIVGTMDGEFIWDSLDAFIEESKNLVGQHGEITSRIESLQITGDMALVTVGGRYWKRWFTRPACHGARVRGARSLAHSCQVLLLPSSSRRSGVTASLEIGDDLVGKVLYGMIGRLEHNLGVLRRFVI